MKRFILALGICCMSASFASADFVVDDFDSMVNPVTVPTGTVAITNNVSFTSDDDFGNSYAIDRSITVIPAPTAGMGVGGGTISNVGASLSANATLEIAYDFSAAQSPSNTFALGYYAKNFRIEGIETAPNNAYALTVTATRGNGTTASLSLGNVNAAGSPPIFFDLTNLGDVGILNDLATLTFSFTDQGTGGFIDFQDFALIATPEPTSLVSLGSLACLGFVSTLRRRRKEVA